MKPTQPNLPALDPPSNYLDVDAIGYIEALENVRAQGKTPVSVTKLGVARYRIFFQPQQKDKP